MYSNIGKSVLNDHLGSSTDPCYIQNRVIMNRVIKRLRCSCLYLTTFRSQASMVSEKSTVFTFSYRKV